MPYVSEKYEFIYLATPATGGSATLQAFNDWEMGFFVPEEPIFSESGELLYDAKHGGLPLFIELGLMKPEWEDYLLICGIRNPFTFHLNQYERAKYRLKQLEKTDSHFFKMYSEEERDEKRRMYEDIASSNFKDYMINKFAGKKNVMLHSKFHEGADFVIHQETLDDDIEQLKKTIDLPSDFSVGEKGVTPGGRNTLEKCLNYYDEELIELVYTLNKPFFEKFPEYESAL